MKGIVEDRTLLSRIDDAGAPVMTSWGAPTATARTYLEQAEAAAKKTLADVNQLFAEDVAAFRKQVQDSGIGLLSEQAPITIE